MVTVIVLNFNGMRNNYLINCLRSLLSQTYDALQIVVVDNASDDASAVCIEQNFPEVVLIKNKENLGFCRGNNVGYEQALGEYVLFANNDVVFRPDCVEKLVEAINLAPDIGMVAPKLRRPDQTGSATQLLDSAGLLLRKDLTLRDRGFEEPDIGQYEIPTYLFAPCGAAAFYRRDLLEEVRYSDGALWDEDFVAYYEDGDLGWRIQQRGWRCLYYPFAVVEHHRGGSSASAFFNKPPIFKAHTIKNRYLMILKNASPGLVGRCLPFILVREALIWGYLCLHPRLLFTVVRVLYNTVPIALHKRRQFSARKSKDVFECCSLR